MTWNMTGGYVQKLIFQGIHFRILVYNTFPIIMICSETHGLSWQICKKYISPPKFQGWFPWFQGIYRPSTSPVSVLVSVFRASKVPVVWGKLHLPIKRTGPLNKEPSHAGSMACHQAPPSHRKIPPKWIFVMWRTSSAGKWVCWIGVERVTPDLKRVFGAL